MTGLLFASLAATLAAGPSPGAPAAAEIPPYSEALARERGPTEAPFRVTYRSANKVLTFVGADHVFTRENSTVDVVRRAFDDLDPFVVIVEGFPTALGKNFAPIADAARRRERADADAFALSEAVFAASLALARDVPFYGGEPSLAEELDGLVAKGYERGNVQFAVLLRTLGQARRSGEMPVGDPAAFTARFAREADAVARMAGTAPATESQFVADYRRIVGVDPVSDDRMPRRYDPGTGTLLQRMAADNMRVRDEHLLSTILEQLAAHDRVLVVYGSSHWTTLSRALETRLGKPKIVAGTAAR
jgi:hypothetical protein